MPIHEDTDAGLLRRYADEGAEDAFAELVRRHLGLVYSAAARQLGDADRARDIAQSVFVELARHAGPLSRHPALIGWLHTTTFQICCRARRDDERRRRREEAAQAMQERAFEESGADWQRLRPALDAALQELNEEDRLAVLLRHLEGRSLREVGAAIGISEDAARMRVQRALDRLQAILVKNGVVTPGLSLAANLGAHAIETVPAGLSMQITAGIVAQAAVGLSGGAVATSSLWMTMKTPLILTGLAAIIALPFTIQSRRIEQLRAEHERLAVLNLRAEEVGRAAEEENLALRREMDEMRALRPELERLRAEVARSQSRADEPVPAAVMEARVQRESAGAQAKEAAVDPEYVRAVRDRENDLIMVNIGVRAFARDNKGRLPDSFDEMILNFHADSPVAEVLERFEPVSPPWGPSTGELRFFLIREKTPRQRPDGPWERGYAMADGSVRTLTSPTADFTMVEEEYAGIAGSVPDNASVSQSTP